ncbi:MAG: SoxR reducing system RseC family protein [Massilibacteroides sp.]|nr:SoxR reducing system RseC family protein [Massilibacteroides sp.]MDD3061721.1 SoxR reducing system RseC family protein [Massilibacteroides sp.]MDD4114316.1 SoxR reducing system RseC family protein [Massilibacteroides sp.]MDD4660604.1 SoxR reducing system RseC family protein [Massilibacteroides sp.]
MSDTIYHTGIIERIDRDKVYVKIIQQSACAGCHAKSMCGMSECKNLIVEIEGNYDSFKVNESVEIEGQSSLGYQAVFYAFVLPLLLVLGTVIFFIETNRSELVSAFAGIAVLPVYYIVLYFFRDKFKKKFVFAMKKLN